VCVLFIITFLTAGVGGSTKKFAFGCACQLGYAVGNIIGPQTYVAKDAPTYYVSVQLTSVHQALLIMWQPTKYTMLAFLLFTMILLASYGLIHKMWNMKRISRMKLMLKVSAHASAMLRWLLTLVCRRHYL
jgi:ACS family allantoate permease-like MFS transporter